MLEKQIDNNNNSNNIYNNININNIKKINNSDFLNKSDDLNNMNIKRNNSFNLELKKLNIYNNNINNINNNNNNINNNNNNNNNYIKNKLFNSSIFINNSKTIQNNDFITQRDFNNFNSKQKKYQTEIKNIYCIPTYSLDFIKIKDFHNRGNILSKTISSISNQNNFSIIHFTDKSYMYASNNTNNINNNNNINNDINNININGYGILFENNGTIYKGIYKNSIPSIYGIFYSINNEVITEGTFVENNLEGIGKEKWKDTSYYMGEFKFNKKDGIGTYRWSDGTLYMGEFIDNQMNGIGIIRYVDDREYEGEISNGLMNGYGKFSWPDGKKFFGNYDNGKKNGFGILFDGKKKNNVFIGFWKDGKLHSVGIKIKNNKNVHYYLFREGFKEKELKSGYECLKYLTGNKKNYNKLFSMNEKNLIKFINQKIFE